MDLAMDPEGRNCSPLPFLHGWRKIPGDGSSIGIIVFSPDGTLIATGDDKGTLSIWQATPAWGVIRKYFLRSRIRGLCWNPVQRLTLFVGCASGCLYTVRLMDIGESANVRRLPGYIHSLAINESASKLAIGYTNVEGLHIAFVEEPCGDLQRPLHRVPFMGDHLPISIPHTMYFLNEEVLLISYFGLLGIHAHETSHPYKRLWTIKPRQGHWIAGAALSPSGSTLAATNMHDGIDWYSITRREYVSTTYYDVQGASQSRRLVGITFLDEVTVLAGHVDGHIVLATTTMTGGPRLFTLRRKPLKSNLIQVLAQGIRSGDCNILVALGEGRDTTFVAAFVTFPRVPKPWVDNRANLGISQVPHANTKLHREVSSEVLVNLKREYSPQCVPKPSSGLKIKFTIILSTLAALASMLFVWHDVLPALRLGSRLSNNVQNSKELMSTPLPTFTAQTTITTVAYTTTTITTTMTIMLPATHIATAKAPTTHSSDTPSTAIHLAMALLASISILTFSSFRSSWLATPSNPAMSDESLDMVPPVPSLAVEPTLEKQPMSASDPDDDTSLSPNAALQQPIGQALPTTSDVRVGDGRLDDSCLDSPPGMVLADQLVVALSCNEETSTPRKADDAPQMNSPDCQRPPHHASLTTTDDHCRFMEDARVGDGRADNSYSDSDPGNTSPDIQKALGNIVEGLGMGRRRLEEDFALPSMQDEEEIIIDPNPELDDVERFTSAHKRLVEMINQQEMFLKDADEFNRAAAEYNKTFTW